MTQTEYRDPLRERQNLVQRWNILLCSHILIHGDIRSASDQTPGAQSKKALRGRLQTEDQVRRLPDVASIEGI